MVPMAAQVADAPRKVESLFGYFIEYVSVTTVRQMFELPLSTFTQPLAVLSGARVPQNHSEN
jgi:hypothetical protein